MGSQAQGAHNWLVRGGDEADAEKLFPEKVDQPDSFISPGQSPGRVAFLLALAEKERAATEPRAEKKPLLCKTAPTHRRAERRRVISQKGRSEAVPHDDE